MSSENWRLNPLKRFSLAGESFYKIVFLPISALGASDL